MNIRKAIRNYELDHVIRRLPKEALILEIGAGAGWQSKTLSKLGFKVEAIDIPESNYSNIREWEVQAYDGSNIPFPDKTFDVVFSSNVLEHIPHVKTFQAEIQRVLAPNGYALHIMPSAIWRIFTILTFYPDRLKKFFLKIFKSQNTHSANSEITRIAAGGAKRGLKSKLFTMLVPPRHGETGNVLSEIYLFSSFRWKKLFLNSQWKVEEIVPCGLLYSGQKLFGEKLSLTLREKLSNMFGSSCVLYVLKKRNG